jgi:hypothetical protein
LSAPLIPARLRKLIGSIGIMVFLAAWIWAGTSLFDFLPNNRGIHLAYFVVVGMGWGLPLMPLMAWMGKADKPMKV